MLYTEILNSVDSASSSPDESWGSYLPDAPVVKREESTGWVLIPNPKDPQSVESDIWLLQRSSHIELRTEFDNEYLGSKRSVFLRLSLRNNSFNTSFPTLTRATDSELSEIRLIRPIPSDVISTGLLVVEEQRKSGLSIMDQVTISGSGSSIETGIQCQGRLPKTVITTPLNDVDIVIDGTGKFEPVKELAKGDSANNHAKKPVITISYYPKRANKPLPEGIEEVYKQAEASAEDEMDGMRNVRLEADFGILLTSENTMIWKKIQSDGTIVVCLLQADDVMHVLEVNPSCAVTPLEDYMSKILKGHDANLFDGITISSDYETGESSAGIEF